MVTNEGLNWALNKIFRETTGYVAPFTSASYVPAATDTAANFPSLAAEATTQYSEGTRQPHVNTVSTSKLISNAGNMAAFTAASAVTLYGVGLTTNSIKGSTTGTLMASTVFDVPKTLSTGEKLLVTVEIGAASG